MGVLRIVYEVDRRIRCLCQQRQSCPWTMGPWNVVSGWFLVKGNIMDGLGACSSTCTGIQLVLNVPLLDNQPISVKSITVPSDGNTIRAE